MPFRVPGSEFRVRVLGSGSMFRFRVLGSATDYRARKGSSNVDLGTAELLRFVAERTAGSPGMERLSARNLGGIYLSLHAAGTVLRKRVLCNRRRISYRSLSGTAKNDS